MELHLCDALTLGLHAMNQKFFEEREDQSEVKARIVSKYFAVWAKIVLPWSQAKKIGYIDLFAGPGRYRDGAVSTPLMVLEQAIKDENLRSSLVTMFNDAKPEHTKNLQHEIDKLPGADTLKFKPQVSTGIVGEEIAENLKSISKVPTFSFIDPFGYVGLSLGLIEGAIKDWGSECVFFFNYNRINAGISNDLVEQHIKALFGEERAENLRQGVNGRRPSDREAIVLENLTEAIKEKGGKFVLPFRFKNEKGTRSSHHLIFVSKHVRGYEIMKEIMAKESSPLDQGVASFEYSPAAANGTPLLFSLSRPFDSLVEELPTRFAGQSLSMLKIYESHHVDTPFIKKNYKDALCKLESDGRITAEPKKRPAGTFGDKVMALFPTLKGAK
jgi:three-Cys-motif partner protein